MTSGTWTGGDAVGEVEWGGGADFLFGLLGGVRVLLVGFEIDGALKFGSVGVEVENGEDYISVSVS